MRPVVKSRILRLRYHRQNTRDRAEIRRRHATLGEIENSKAKVRVTFFLFSVAPRNTNHSMHFTFTFVYTKYYSSKCCKYKYTKNNNDNKINPFGFLLMYSGQLFIIIFAIITAYLTQDWINSFPYVLV